MNRAVSTAEMLKSTHVLGSQACGIFHERKSPAAAPPIAGEIHPTHAHSEVFDDGTFALNTHRTNVHCNDETKIQRRERIHRLIAVDEAVCKRSARISGSGRTGFANGIDKGAEPEHADERNERGTEKFAQTARQLFRVQGY